MFLKSNVKTCPSNLLIAPTIKIFLYLIEYLLSKNFVLKLSEPSTIISKFLIIFLKFLSVIFLLKVFTFVEGFRNYFATNDWIISTFSLQYLIVTLIIVFRLRSLKHYTNVLKEKGRS